MTVAILVEATQAREGFCSGGVEETIFVAIMVYSDECRRCSLDGTELVIFTAGTTRNAAMRVETGASMRLPLDLWGIF